MDLIDPESASNAAGKFRMTSKGERVKGIEPSSQPWEGRILPLYYTRNHNLR